MQPKTKNLIAMRRILLVFLSCICAYAYVCAQAMTVTGVVKATDENDPIIGANVTVQGSTNGTITDFDGNFALTVNKGDVLVISYIGYQSQTKTIISDAPLQIVLQPDNVMLDEVVAIGYGTMRKSDLTGAVTTVKAEELLKAPVSGVDQALQGRAAGVTVVTNSGQPGEAATIRIRGISSAIGGNDPLYVVDGVITENIAFLAANDIESMEILKDASATAIYGSRGANGVILITTKQGTEGKKAQVTFDSYWGFQNRWKALPMMDSKEFAETKLKISTMRNGASEIAYYKQNGFNSWMDLYNLSTAAYFPQAQTVEHPNGFDYSAINTNWQDEVFKKNAFIHNYNLGINGGGDWGHYAFSANYFGQDGIIIGSNYQRVTLRLNSDFNIRKWLTIGEHLNFATDGGRNAMNNNASPAASVLSAALAMAPWDPAVYPEGTKNSQGEDIGGNIAASSNFKNVTNPLSMVKEIEPQSNNERVVGDLYLEIKPVEGFVIRPSISVDYGISRNKVFTNQYEHSSFDKKVKNSLSSSLSRSCSLLEEVTATYAREINKHNFSVMVGQTWQEYNHYGMSGSGATILNPIENNWYLFNTTEDRTNSTDEVARVRRLSFLGRAYYCYDNRYMATVNFRADASSRFSKNPWGFFPSASVAWRISEEPWVKNNTQVIDNLKLRGGWGQVGNDGIPSGSFVPTMFTAPDVFVSYPLGTEQLAQNGAAVLQLVGTDGKWETNEQWDAGIDFSFWNGKLSGTVDYFNRTTKDALLYVNAPAHVGNRYSIVKNVGNINNQGVELTLGHDNRINSNISYHISGNVSFLKNELVKLNGGSPLWGDKTKTDEGMALNSFWGYQYEGIYQSDEEVLEQFYQYESNDAANLHAGDARYKDVNNDGLLNEDDKCNLGNSFPKVTYGINLGAELYGVDIQIFFQGVAGNLIYNALRQRIEGSGAECTLSTSMRDVWVGYTDGVRNKLLQNGINYLELENRNGSIPNPAGSTLNTADNSRFLEDGSYFRLKNLQIGYTFPRKWTEKFSCSKLRVFMTASNLFTVTKYSGYDPEVGGGVDYGNYPQSRTFTFGLNVNF